ncbi:MAG: hypothetical protein JWN20_1816 [Jatrophihabitantaceae bacterium]|nr:hypothetical protein [Jatrophihabitantaceae bacterium]
MARFARLFSKPEDHAPEPVRALIGKERLLAWAIAADGSVLAAVPTGLWGPFAPASGAELMPWWRISKVIWRDDVLTVTAADVDEVLILDRPALPMRLAEPGAIPSIVRKRVEGSIRKTERVSLPTGEVRVVARTVAGKDGLTWLARLEPGSRDNAELRADLVALIARLTDESDAALRM